MASSDDDGEPVPHTVSNYHFVDDKDEPISFAELPVQWNEGERPDGKRKQIFLHGNTDNGLYKIYKQVKAWKFDLSDAKPEISVLYKENNWIKLQEPRKSFKDTIRTILIAVHCLHLVKKNPETSRGSLWNHLSKIFRLYETRSSENDLVDHSTLISEAVKRDENLAKSKFLVTFLKEMPRKRKAVDEDVGTTTKSGFVVDDDEMMDKDEEDESDEESDLFDCVCAICDNGGDLLCCEGRCMRSFHATVEAGSESVCESLGFSDEHVEAIQKFFCKNCQYKKHQCFSCGELGSSDKSSGAEVFSCVSATCGRFYHPHCVAKLLHHESETDTEELQKKIAAGKSFTCPIHKCHVCKQGENKMDPELQFAVCRRCPKSYHRKCLPRKIAFEDLEDEGIVQRAWEGLIPNRILIYCLKHEIDDDELGTPIRNHIKFPKIAEKKKNQASALLSSREKLVSKRRSLASEDAPRKRAVEKAIKGVEKLSSAIKEADSSKERERRLSGPVSSKKQKVMDTSRKPSNKTASMKVSKVTTDEGGTSLGESLYTLISNSEVGKFGKEDKPDSERKQTLTAKPVAKETFSSLPLDADTNKRKHAIDDDELGTPIWNHIKFPKIAEKKKNQASALLSSGEKLVSKRRSLASEDAPRKRAVEKAIKGVEKLSSAIKEADSSKERERRLSGPVSSKKQKVMDTPRKPSNETASMKVSKVTTDEGGTSLGESLYALISNSEVGKFGKEDKPDSERKQTLTAKPVAKETFSSLPLDADTKRRIMALMKDVSSAITQEQIIKRLKVPLTHACSSNYLVDKAITLGKVEGSVEALRAALQKLEEGCSIEDAKAVCEPGLLNQIIKWKNKLNVYLAPFLYGMRYTSFGRHFTKVDKLKEIVDILHWYVGDGDMIVDFCCGANDFSCLMKKKLDKTGKNCSYKNYDILQTKNDFNFEKRDWMSILPKELPTGSELIMGLNPPFGVNATLANKFIDKALEFKPKLLIIMVPRETERLDKKKPPYDLVWEDDELLAGKSFYLPGSVDVDGKQMDQSNVNPPPLYLWSRPDWTAKHKEIAEQHGHTSRVREESHLEENHRALFNDYPLEHHGPNGEMSMLKVDHAVQNEETEQLQQRGASVTGSHKEGFTCNNRGREGNENHDQGKNHSGEKAEKGQHGKGKQKCQKGSGEIAVEDKQNARSSPLTCNNGGSEGNENHDQGKNQSGENAEKRQCDKGKRKRWKGLDEITVEDKQNARSCPLTCNNGKKEGNENHDQGKNQSGENAEKRQCDKGKRKRWKGLGEITLEDKQNARSCPLTCNNGKKEGNENHDQGKNQSGENAEKRQCDKGKRKHGKESGEIALEDKQNAQSSLTCNNGEREGNENHDQGKNQSGENAEKRQRDKGKRKHGKESGEIALEDKQNAQSSPVSGLFKGMSHHSPPKVTGDKSLDGHQSNFLKTSLHTEVGKEGYWLPNHSSAGPVCQFQMGYGGTQADDLERKSSLNSQETHSGASPGRDYEVRNSEEHIPGYQRERINSHGYSRMNASTMQRYSPQLDELNHTRMNSSRFKPPSASRNGISDPLASRPGFLADSFGFAPGPYRLFSPQNSSGWLDE